MRPIIKWLPRLLAGVLMLCAFSSRASSLTDIPDDSPRPMPVGVALSVLDVQGVKENLNTMLATVELRQTWQDPRLAFNPVAEGSDRVVYTEYAALKFLDTHWNPHITITNLISTTGTPLTGVEIRPDGLVTEIRTITAGFYIRSDYSDFPFDRQSFPIDIASDRYNRNQLTLVYGADEKAASVIDRSVHLAQWQLIGLRAVHAMRVGWDGTDFEHLSINVLTRRKTLQYAPQIFLPYLFIMMAPLILLINKMDNIVQQATMLSGAALATIALQFSVGASFPDVVLTDNIVSRMFWFAYAFFITMLLLVVTVYNPTVRLSKNRYVVEELRAQLNWMPAVAFLILLIGTILSPVLRQAFS